MQQMIIDNVTDKWRARLMACVQARGEHFEHLLQSQVCLIHFGVSHACKKTGNNDDFIAYLNTMFNECCLQVFIFYV